MGIDGIGKGGGGIPTTPGTTGPARAQETGKTFSVEKPEGATAPAQVGNVEGTEAASPLAQLRAGKLDLNGYLDAKVNEATAHLHDVPPAQLDTIKSMLRDRIASDPALTDLVQQATGQVPALPED